MVAGEGPAKEPKRRWKMKEMVGGFGGEETGGGGFLIVERRGEERKEKRTGERRIGNWDLSCRFRGEGAIGEEVRDSVIGLANDVR
jgi:hypothetical protein